MKSLVGKIGTLALVAMAGIAVNACSSTLDKHSPSDSTAQGGEHIGSVGLKLQPVAGITVNNVHYIVTAGNPAATPAPATVAEGNLPTPGTSDNFSFGISLPVGTGYFISLSGVSAETGDDITCTGLAGPFAVTANSSTPFNMTLTCVDNTSGQILSTVTVDTPACPRLIVDYVVAEPGSALTGPVGTAGSDIAVHSVAHDLDNPTETITYAWSVVDPTKAGVGQFAPANAANSSFHCSAAGNAVEIEVTATNHQCSKVLKTVVSCTDAKCGNGVVDPGETCDKALDPTCPADCTRVCGDGNAESGEACDPLPLDPVVCIPPGEPGECTIRTIVCGNGFVQTGEQCDGTKGPGQVPLPPGTTCDASCHTHGPACGDGITGGTEQCDGGTGTNSAPVEATTRTCTQDCASWSSDTCVTCEQAGDCFASSDNCLGVGGSFSLAQQKTCTDVAVCMETKGCLTGPTGSLGKCYCGTLSTAACGAAPFDLTAPGAPNGPCAAIMQQGNPGVTTNSAILGGLTNKSRPAGAAGQRLNCDKLNCANECGVN